MNRMFRQRKYDTRRIDRQYAEETDVYVMLYNSYADALYAYGMGFGFDNETVKDVIHDIFLDIMTRQVDRSRVDKCALPHRSPRLRVSLTSLDAMIESEHVLRIRQTIESLLNQLSPKQREALLLRFVYEMEYDDIAVILDATPHAVRKFVSKGLGKLRKGRECGKTMKIAT